MIKIIQAKKDTYVTNKLINAVASTGSNVGQAGTLNLFKLYGYSLSGSQPVLELSRLLLQFDLSTISSSWAVGDVDLNNFSCQLKLFDVYGGQPCPNNFNVSVFPLSKSFDEGNGRDVVFYQDKDAANYINASSTTSWISGGAGYGAGAACDYITGAIINNSLVNMECTQLFETGDEDLLIDVTKIVSATLTNKIPDAGFRVSLSAAEETDQNSYFVKRFAARHAYDKTKRPQLLFKFDGSLQDETQLIVPYTTCSVYLRNYAKDGTAANLPGEGGSVTGANCLILTLSSSYQTFNFSGSQVVKSGNNVVGQYYANVVLNGLTSSLKSAMLNGPVKFKPLWKSSNGTVTYKVGDDFFVQNFNASTAEPNYRNLLVSVVPESSGEVTTESSTTFRVNIFDNTLNYTKAVKTSVKSQNLVFKDAHFRLVNSKLNQVVIPFDTTNNSTRLSSDAEGCYFILDPSVLLAGEQYHFDVMIHSGGQTRIFEKASSVFKAA